jgi:hypothetical protein
MVISDVRIGAATGILLQAAFFSGSFQRQLEALKDCGDALDLAAHESTRNGKEIAWVIKSALEHA